MTTILCATRGGQASFPNQDAAIALAKEREARLIFLHISNVEFLGQMASPILIDVETELEHMGEFLLAMAQERAANAGVQAEAVVKHGEFRDALCEAIEENEVDVVMFGSPGKQTSVLTRAYLEELAKSLTLDSELEILVLKDGEVVNRYQGGAGS